ncbi:hypothetical protein QWM81_26875 [Streptomyces ficellus]|uniref:DUF2637 domain-containing protein n=1 Tax=Streptomyces ficellus TaxID=1977088 RepID=A0ABT7ZEZ2_9ACTN|nr:hypothetical protein [Streptomyces ficellus]MDN3297596.1 hypothetical protein [Streptomyces ficellus]
MTYLVRAVKVASTAAAATLVAWWLIRSLYTLIDHATEADSARNPLAGVPYYLAANAAGILCQPFALWAGARLAGVRGNHLAIVISTYVWATMTTAHLVDSTPSPGEAVLWVAIQSAAATGASLLQARIMPTSTQPKERSS